MPSVLESESVNGFWRDLNTKEAVELTQALVRIPSITSREGLAISEAVRDWYAQRGIEVELVPAGAERASVVAEAGSGEPVLVLNAHLDTKWTDGMTIEPFAAELRDGKLYGRGACDTKGSVAGMMVAFAAAVAAGLPRVGTLRTVFEVGEEGDDWAALSLFEQGYLKATWAVVGEPSSGRIEIGNRGRLAGAVRTFGRSTHTATAELGVNAIEKMARLVCALRDLPYRQKVDPVWGQPPLNVWKIRSEGWEATVPYQCTAWFDARLNPDAGPEVVLEQIEELLTQLSREDADFRGELVREAVKLSLPAAHVEVDHELVDAARRALRKVAGKEPNLGANPAMTMAHVLITRGVPAIIYGPGSIAQAHTADEWVKVEEIEQATRFYAALVEELLG